MNKNIKRKRRATKTRTAISSQGAYRLSVHRTANHIYAQLISANGSNVLAAASTLEKSIRAEIKHGGNKEAATKIGKLIAERCLAAGISKVAFDRSGYKYHGRVKALADAAREGGVEF